MAMPLNYDPNDPNANQMNNVQGTFQLAQQLASANSNQNPAVAQGNQMAQPAGNNFQATAPVTSSNPTIGQGMTPPFPAAPAAAPPTTTTNPSTNVASTVVPGGASQGNPVAGYPSVTQSYASPYGNASALAQQLTTKATAGNDPTVIQGRKGQAKDEYTSMAAQNKAQIQQQQASQGLSGNYAASLGREVDNRMPGDLTNLYRNIDQQAEQTDFQNLLAGMNANVGYGGQLASESIQRDALANQLALGNRNIDLGVRGLELNEANATYDRNNQTAMIMAALQNFGRYGTGGA
jgi:hypothetical protein